MHKNKRNTRSSRNPSAMVRPEKKFAKKTATKAKTPQKPKNISKEQQKIVLFNKPFDVLCQFTDDQKRKTLADFVKVKEVYAAGRLDKDSEGLLLLTNDGKLQHKIASPKFKEKKTYWVQVEGEPTAQAIEQLCKGVELKDGLTKPAKVRIMVTPKVWERTPPIRERKNIPTTWLEVKLTEGRNRQVRRMTAHVGHPTLRLVRYAIGTWTLDSLAPGEYKLL